MAHGVVQLPRIYGCTEVKGPILVESRAALTVV